MKVTPTTFTVAEYCEQMRQNKITINRDYQRSSKVWPPAARSYLIDTILYGYPIPKLSLYQKTDLKTRNTLKEIVDGQQRSQAILDFLEDKLRLSANSSFRGSVFSQLEESKQQAFVDYQISVDLFVSATDAEIREQFRRINSYNVPLNPQEQRHASYQGLFKWFIVDMSEQYAQILKDLVVFSESQLARMEDAKFISDLCLAFINGIESASESKLNNLYKSKDSEFPEQQDFTYKLKYIFDNILSWKPIHGGPLMKKYNLFTLALAITHWQNPLNNIRPIFDISRQQVKFDTQIILTNLTALASAQDEEQFNGPYGSFVEAASKTTDRKAQREERVRWLCRALLPKII